MTAPTLHPSSVSSAASFVPAAVVTPPPQDGLFELEESRGLAAEHEDTAEADFEPREWMGAQAEQRSAHQGDAVDEMLRELGIELRDRLEFK